MIAVAVIMLFKRSDGMHHHVHTLHVMTAPDRRASFVMTAGYDASRRPKFSAERYTIANVRLSVAKHALGYQEVVLLLEQVFPGPYKYVGTEQFPSWTGHYIPSRTFILPTGRLFFVDKQLACVVFDGDECKLYLMDEAKGTLEETASLTEDRRQGLRRLWETSFAPEDVYWDWCLIHNTTFFGISTARRPLMESTHIDTAVLFRHYDEMKKDALPER